MSSEEDNDHPPQQLLQPLTQFQPLPSSSSFTSMASNASTSAEKPYQITFSSRDDEKAYTRKLLDNCATFNGDSEQLVTWLKKKGECLPVLSGGSKRIEAERMLF